MKARLSRRYFIKSSLTLAAATSLPLINCQSKPYPWKCTVITDEIHPDLDYALKVMREFVYL